MNDLSIIYEDDAFLLVNKQSGVTVNRSDTTKGEKTMQDLVEEYLQTTFNQDSDVQEGDGEEEYGSDFNARSGIVHRLDKETSGILIVAKTREAFSLLQQEFKNREVHKSYRALAHGRVTPESGEINVPVGRLPWNRRSFGIVAGGRESVTFYQVLGYFRTDDKRKELVTFLELKPITGRTHQIRVHLQYLGYPIFSDFLYAGRKTQREDRKLLGRVFLHAAKISFIHPTTKERVDFEAPLPPELAAVMDHLVPIV